MLQNTSAEPKLLTEFTSDMFRDIREHVDIGRNLMQQIDYYTPSNSSISYSESNISKGILTNFFLYNIYSALIFSANVQVRIDEIDVELADLKARRQQQEIKIGNIENLALRQRFQENLEGLLQEQLDKEHEKYELIELIKQMD